MSVRIAVIGTGVMGFDHAKIIAGEIPGCSLQTVCDKDLSRARQVADQLGAADISDNPEKVIQDNSVDAVIIASPDSTHAPLTIACIKAGKRVLCEKPLALTSDDCLKVMKEENAAGEAFVQVGFMRRYDRSYKEMKSALDNGKLGRALLMHNFHRNVDTPSEDFTGAMAILLSAPHEFDAARYILNTEYSSVSAFQPKRSDNLVAPVILVLETTDGQIVNIEINNNAKYGYDVRAELVGESGSVSTDNIAYSALNTSFTKSTQFDSDWRTRFADAYRLQNKDFIRFVNAGKISEIAASSLDGYYAAIIAEMGVKSLTENRKIYTN